MIKKLIDKKWLNKTLESLEKDVWPELSVMDKQGWLIVECNALRKKQLKNFSIENIRQMIEQNISLEYMIPMALDRLKGNILVEGDCYPSDLLCNVLISDEVYWNTHIENWNTAYKLFQENEELLNNSEELSDLRKDIFRKWNRFSTLNEVK